MSKQVEKEEKIKEDITSEEKKDKKNNLPLIICIALIIILLAVIVLLVFRDKKSDETDETPKREVVVNEENAEEVASDFIEQEVVEPGSYEVTMNSTWNFKDGSSSSDNAYVENSTANTNAVYFDVQLSDTGETIYESPVIPVGSYLDNIILDKSLTAGTYDCILTYHLVDDDQNTLSTLKMGITINVEQ